MTPPVNFVYRDGAYWAADGSGPYTLDPSANPVLSSGAQNPGSSPLLGYQQAAAIHTTLRVTAGGIIISGPCIIDSFAFETVGTPGNFQAFDDSSAVAASARTPSIGFASLPTQAPLVMGTGPKLFSIGLFLTIPTGCVCYVNRLPAP